jgi:hypothetical protein
VTDSPHVSDGLAADACAACHRTHVSSDQNLLAASYRDRLLKPAAEAYQGSDFSLCYTCHSEAPFTAPGTGATNFELHAQHVSGVVNPGGGGTDILVPGDGQGNAICAECHYRLHSTPLEVDLQLVKFAPNVVAKDGVLEWTGPINKSCTLTCHGHEHVVAGY